MLSSTIPCIGTASVRVLSDLHYEFCGLQRANNRFWERISKWVEMGSVPPQQSILVLPGDLCRAFKSHGSHSPKVYARFEELLRRFKETYQFSEVVFVAGNHEFYQSQREFGQVIAELKRVADITGTHFLNRSRVMLNIPGSEDHKIEILGCTLWAPIDPRLTLQFNDFSAGNVFGSAYSLAIRHQEDAHWLQGALAAPKDPSASIRIAVTHHVPHPVLIHERFFQYGTDGFSATDLLPDTLELRDVDYFFCGHSHEHNLYKSATTLFYLNPLGYPDEQRVTQVQSGEFPLPL